MRLITPLFIAFVALSSWTLAPAARANDVDLVVSPKVPVGTKPSLTVKVNKDVKSATLDVKSAAGHARQTLGPKPKGGEIVFTLPQDKPGKVTWAGSLAVTFDDDTSGTMPLSFQTEILSSFKFTIKDEDVKLADHSIVVTSEHDTAKIELEIYGDEGELLAAVGKDFDNVKAGTPMSVEWIPKKPGDTLRIHVVVHDTSTAFKSTDLFPWTITIPHEEVEFETGKADVRPTEEPKLTSAQVELDKVIKKYSAAVKVEGVTVKLFVLGHTDTVGPSSSNRGLSDRRAQAIANWFKKKGVKVPIYARGFGEDMLKVETPDETAEQKNRRADYDVSVDSPTRSLDGWTRIN